MDDNLSENTNWVEFKTQYKLHAIDIPYTFSIAAVNVVGIFHLRDDFESSSTDGIVVGAVNGSYNLDRNNGQADFYDPTGQLLRLVLILDIGGRELRCRFDNRKWDGGWNEGDWAIIWRG